MPVFLRDDVPVFGGFVRSLGYGIQRCSDVLDSDDRSQLDRGPGADVRLEGVAAPTAGNHPLRDLLV